MIFSQIIWFCKLMKCLKFSMLHLIFIALLVPLPLIQVGGFTSGLYLYHILSFIMLGMVLIEAIKNNFKIKYDRDSFLLFCYIIFVFFLSGIDLTKEWLIALLSFFCFFSSNLYSANSKHNIEEVRRLSKYYLLIISILGISSYLNGNYLYINPYILGEEGSDDFVFTGFLGLTRGSLGVIFPVLISLTLIDFYRNNFKDKTIISFAILASIICILLSGSRTGLFLCLIAILLNFLLFRSKSIGVIITVATSILIMLIPYFYDFINFDRFNDIGSSYSVESRKQVQGWTLEYIFNNFLQFIFGMGYDSKIFIKSIKHELTHPHNEFLYTIWSIGVVGFVLYLMFLYNNYYKSDARYKKNILIIYMIFFVGSMSVGSILTPSLRLAYLGFFGFFLVKTFRKTD